jgi:hypothetical protein
LNFVVGRGHQGVAFLVFPSRGTRIDANAKLLGKKSAFWGQTQMGSIPKKNSAFDAQSARKKNFSK